MTRSRTKRAKPSSKLATRLDGFPIVGIGASAGGLEAMTQLLKPLPPNSGLALVLVQHLDPTHESALVSILARSTAMSVAEARHNARLVPNNIYVIPPNKFMGISDGKLKLSARGAAASQSAVDHFFRSLAQEEGSRAIGVVLSGNGADGTQGLLAIKAAGGITFAQEEKSAKYPAMPGSAITAGCVDFVLPPERIARELARLAGHPYVSPGQLPEEQAVPAEERAFIEILIVLRQRTGVDFANYKHPTLRRRIQRRMALHKMESLKDYGAFLRSNTAEAKELYNDILIHVTGFFRDPAVFQVLKKKIIPRLLKQKAPADPMRVWVPGCSTGEEVYSLAICLVEYMSEHKLHHPVQIFGTDINDRALDKARAGFFPENIKADISAERLRRFFVRADGGYRVSKNVREVCIFARQNLVVDPPFSNLDLISCRNVLIYLGPQLQRKVLPLFHYALRPDACLLLGTSETVGSFADLFALVDKTAKVFSKKASRMRPSLSFGMGVPEKQPTASSAAPPATSVSPGLADLQKQADRLMLSHFSPSGVIINRQLEVLQFRGHTGLYLEHVHGEASLNVLKMAREGLAMDLRSAVSKAVKQEGRVRHEGGQVRQNGEVLKVTLEVIPFGSPPSTEKFYLVLFEPAARPLKLKPGPKLIGGKAVRLSGADPVELVRLREELAATRESLQAIVEEQEGTNEELSSANEEIMSSNEELQSTNEEMETAKEELQSTNEELTTLNDELESRNGELESVNNDLHNLLASANIPIIILGPDLRIRRFTGMAERTFNLIPSDIGRPLSDINLPISIPDLAKHVLEVFESLATQELEVRSEVGRWWSLRIRPYKTTDNRIDGAVLALMDIDALKNNLRLADQGRSFVEAVLNTIRQPVLALDSELKVQFLNPAFCQAFDFRAEEALQRQLYSLADGDWDFPDLRKLLEETLPQQGRVSDAVLEHEFKGLGPRRLRLSAQRLTHDGAQHQITVLAFEELPEGKA